MKDHKKKDTTGLSISLQDRDVDKWGPNELVLRLTMARLGTNTALLPYCDHNSTLAERDYICKQLLKEYKNVLELCKNEVITQEIVEEQNKEIVVWLLKMILYGVSISVLLIWLFT